MRDYENEMREMNSAQLVVVRAKQISFGKQ